MVCEVNVSVNATTMIFITHTHTESHIAEHMEKFRKSVV